MRTHTVGRQRPYHVEYTGSRPITEVKQRRARLVLGWVTAWEHRVPLPFCKNLLILIIKKYFIIYFIKIFKIFFLYNNTLYMYTI